MVLLNYAYHHKYMTTVHALYTAIDLDRKSFKNDKQSIEILERYATMVHVLSVTYMFLAFLCSVVVVTSTLSMVSVTDVPKENDSSFWQRPVALKRLEKTSSYYSPSFTLCVATYCLNTFIWGAIELTYLAFSEHVFALFSIVR
ncbi:hypothetical protein K0M31_007753 [Melipona bicolor]|uniref:Uncharacterized protein n=1 Tax=Melipona bicolor TaxID=60889 RepID=A0AA40KVY2_9HYME|nr:hypothetical protein K0M31_007753 [Melipona bicolor]